MTMVRTQDRLQRLAGEIGHRPAFGTSAFLGSTAGLLGHPERHLRRVLARRGVIGQRVPTPAGMHVDDGALDVIGVDASVLAVAHVLAFEVDPTAEHAEFLGDDFLLSTVGMTWITNHRSGSSTAMTSSSTSRSSSPTHSMRASRSSVAG